ncbi:MAG TPA: hypothetical protein VEZ12_06675 [Herpetosiphonaceae bacterium]|nr:hypothetical protein [Herpetosiphonaceae bacterium]
MHRTYRLAVLATLLLIVLGSLPAARPAHAQNPYCFPETGQCVEGRFRSFWAEGGGLTIFGFPITPARDERNPDTGNTYLTQWFERNRFELHPENAAPYDVLLGRLGADRLAQMGRNWQAEGRESGPKAGCLWFPQTGHNVCDQQPGAGNALAVGFMSYWRREQLNDRRLDPYARSLALHGLPLTEARMETNASGDRVLTQWFERTRMEWHPDNLAPFRVLLGLLGSELRGGTSQQPAGNIRYVHAGALHELQPDGTSRRITALIDQGTVLDAVHWQDQVIVLSERGLQRVATSGAQSIATFSQGNARFGSLTAPEQSGMVFYSYARDANSPMGFEGVVGMITNGTTAAKLFDAPNVVTVLGLSTDSKGLLVIDRGQDPSFVQVRVVQIPTGETIDRLPITGVGAVAQSPDRVNVRIAAVDQPGEHPDVLNLYDLTRADLGRRVIELPQRGWDAWGMLWSRDSRYIYVAMAPSVSDPEYELYRVDVASGRGELVASKLPPGTRLIRMSPDDRQIVAATQTTAGLIDLATGAFNRQTVPAEALIVR